MKIIKMIATLAIVVISITCFVMTSYAETTLSTDTYQTAVSHTNVSVSTVLDITYNYPIQGIDSAGYGTTTATSSFYAKSTALLYKSNSFLSYDAQTQTRTATAAAEFIGYSDAPYLTHFETTHEAWNKSNQYDRVFVAVTFISPNCDGTWTSTNNHILYNPQ